jgi:hypothetical protein
VARKIFPFLALFVLTAGLVAPALAWDSFGHMAVAYAAYQKLTPQSKARVSALLKMNPYYPQWVKWLPPNTSAADQDMMLFMLAATWPDEIKSDRTYTSDGNARGNRPEGSPDPSANKGYADKLMHKYWHFVDTPFSMDGTALPAIPTPNAQERIALFRGVLASDSDDTLKSYDLTWLLHLVGDVHQPLHCATRVSRADPEGDNGGNNVKVSCTGCANELHAFWDNLLGTSASEQAALQPVIEAARNLPVADAGLAAKSDEKVWVSESFQAAQNTVYMPPIGAGDGPFPLTPAYESAAKTLAMQRVALAGARLANLINNELK